MPPISDKVRLKDARSDGILLQPFSNAVISRTIVEVATYLLSKGANLDAQDAFGVTPLLAAVYEGTRR